MSDAMNKINDLRVAIARCSDVTKRNELNSEMWRLMISAADLRVGDVMASLVNRGPLQWGER